MGKVFISVTTFIMLAIVLIHAIRTHHFFRHFKPFIHTINAQYLDLFRQKSLLARILQTILLILAQIFVSVNIITLVIKYLDTYLNTTFDILLKILIVVAVLFLIYIALGYLLLYSSKIYHVFYQVENQDIKLYLLLSYFLLSTYFSVLLVLPNQFEECYAIGLIGTAICYILNLKVLLKIIRNPNHIKTTGEATVEFSTIAVVAILILIMIVLTLFLAVCLIHGNNPAAYNGVQNEFDLFYYTIITFTTVGYGDIVPVSSLAKMMSIIISTTSVICLTVFLSSILSYNPN